MHNMWTYARRRSFRVLPFPKQALRLLLFTWQRLYVKCSLCFFPFIPSRSKILNPSLRFSLSPPLYRSRFFPPRTERDRVAREPPTEQTGVPAWNARPHTDAATLTRGGGSVSPLRGLPVASPGLPPARASATPRAHRRWRAAHNFQAEHEKLPLKILAQCSLLKNVYSN